jgi:hypothetical protein
MNAFVGFHATSAPPVGRALALLLIRQSARNTIVAKGGSVSAAEFGQPWLEALSV